MHKRFHYFIKKELALMHGSRRTATVTCKSEVELLAVWREDFVDIFMPHTYEKEPEHIKFLRTVTSLSGWPIHKLPYHDPKICCFTYFRLDYIKCSSASFLCFSIVFCNALGL